MHRAVLSSRHVVVATILKARERRSRYPGTVSSTTWRPRTISILFRFLFVIIPIYRFNAR